MSAFMIVVCCILPYVAGKRMDDTIKRTRAILLLLPDEIVKHVPAVRSMMKRVSARSSAPLRACVAAHCGGACRS